MVKRKKEEPAECWCWVSSYAPAKKGEKRCARWRSTPSIATQERLQRALSQRMFLLDEVSKGEESRLYRVLGSTGNVYKVVVAREPSCTCPDAKKGFACKHLFFVMVRVLRCDRDAPIVYQRGLLGVELRALFERADSNRWQPPEANQATKKAYLAATGRAPEAPPPPDGECAICFEPLDGKLARCQMHCKKALHDQCFQKWRRAAGSRVSCPSCRALWAFSTDDALATTTATVNEGYLNFAATQGQDRERDTSTYATPYYAKPRYYSRGWGGPSTMGVKNSTKKGARIEL